MDKAAFDLSLAQELEIRRLQLSLESMPRAEVEERLLQAAIALMLKDNQIKILIHGLVRQGKL